jgi:hypothetical protein
LALSGASRRFRAIAATGLVERMICEKIRATAVSVLAGTTI